MAKLAKRYACKICGGTYITTKESSCTPWCCGQIMSPVIPDEKPVQISDSTIQSERIETIEGLRYYCEACGLEMIAIQKGNIPCCCGKPLNEHRNRINALSE